MEAWGALDVVEMHEAVGVKTPHAFEEAITDLLNEDKMNAGQAAWLLRRHEKLLVEGEAWRDVFAEQPDPDIARFCSLVVHSRRVMPGWVYDEITDALVAHPEEFDTKTKRVTYLAKYGLVPLNGATLAYAHSLAEMKKLQEEHNKAQRAATQVSNLRKLEAKIVHDHDQLGELTPMDHPRYASNPDQARSLNKIMLVDAYMIAVTKSDRKVKEEWDCIRTKEVYDDISKCSSQGFQRLYRLIMHVKYASVRRALITLALDAANVTVMKNRQRVARNHKVHFSRQLARPDIGQRPNAYVEPLAYQEERADKYHVRNDPITYESWRRFMYAVQRAYPSSNQRASAVYWTLMSTRGWKTQWPELLMEAAKRRGKVLPRYVEYHGTYSNLSTDQLRTLLQRAGVHPNPGPTRPGFPSGHGGADVPRPPPPRTPA